MSKNQSVGNCLVPVWAIPELLSEGSLQLPSFQRDAVWDEERVELLWDSLMRGMPIGNFIVSSSQKITSRNVSESRSVASYKHEDEDKERELLVDGQQRCIGIRQGLTPWTQKSSYRLWLDIDPKENDMRKDYKIKFSFFLCTRSWPWGFKPSDQSWRKCREELFEKHKDIIKGDVDEEVESDPTTWKPDYLLPLNYTWPARAKLPIPFSEILNWFVEDKNIQGDECQSRNLERIERLDESEIEKRVDQLFESSVSRNFKNIWGLEGGGEEGENNRHKIVQWINDHQERICEVLNRKIYFENSFEISGDVQPGELGEAFNRINRLGIQLSNADLFFSGLKLIWSDAHNLVWSIYNDENSGKLISPPGIAHTAVRLAIAENNKELPESDRIADRLGMSLRDVRILLNNPDHNKTILDEVKEFLKEENKNSLKNMFRYMRKIIEYRHLPLANDNPQDIDFGIPLPLLSRIGSKKPYIFHNLLAWIAATGHPIDPNDHELRKRMVRYVLFDYFFVYPNDEYKRRSFLLCFRDVTSFPDQEVVELATSHESDLRIEFFKSDQNFEKALISPDEFAEKISIEESDPVNLRDLLLWAQRFYLGTKFKSYDPTLFFSEASLPWDEDHIYPKGKFTIKGNSCDDPKHFYHCKYNYLNSFGNFRVLDRRENRSDGSLLPKEKLEKHTAKEFFGIKEDDFWNWEVLFIRNYRVTNRFLNKFKYAINSRRISIYRDLFETLDFKNLKAAPIQSEHGNEKTDET